MWQCFHFLFFTTRDLPESGLVDCCCSPLQYLLQYFHFYCFPNVMCQNVARMHCWLWPQVQCWLTVSWWRPTCFGRHWFRWGKQCLLAEARLSSNTANALICVSLALSLSRSLSLYFFFLSLSIYHFIFTQIYWLLYDFTCSVSRFQPQLSIFSSMTILWSFLIFSALALFAFFSSFFALFGCPLLPFISFVFPWLAELHFQVVTLPPPSRDFWDGP